MIGKGADSAAGAGSVGWRPSKVNTIAAWLVFLFLILPSLVVIPMSFGDTDEFVFPPQGISTYLYEKYFFEDNWMETTRQSFVVAVLSTLMCLFFGVTAAYGVVRGTFPGKRLVTLFLLTPMFVPLIVIALGLYIYFATLGLSGSTFSLVVGHTLHGTPFVIVLCMAALRHVDPNLEAAARVMGAGRIYTLLRVTLPLLQPALIASALFAFLISFDEVVIAWFLTTIYTQTLPVKMYSSIQWEISPVLAAVSTLLTFLAFVICVAGVLVQRGEAPETTQG